MLRLLTLSAVLALAASGELDDFAGEWTAIKTYGELAFGNSIPKVQGCMTLKIQPTEKRIKCGEMYHPMAETTLTIAVTHQGKSSRDTEQKSPPFYVLKNHDEYKWAVNKLATTPCDATENKEGAVLFSLDKNHFVMYDIGSTGALFGKNSRTENDLAIIERVDGDFKNAPNTTWDCDEKANGGTRSIGAMTTVIALICVVYFFNAYE